MKKQLFKVWLTLLAILISFSSLAPYVSAAISVPPNSTDSSVPLTATPTINGASTWFFDGYTTVINAGNNETIGSTYRYKSDSGQTVTMINPGSIGSWAEAFGGDKNSVIGDYSSGKIQTYRLTPPPPKQYYERLNIDDIIDASSAKGSYSNGNLYITLPEGAPKITKFKVREPLEAGKTGYAINSTINIDIDIEEYLPNVSTLKYVEVYYEDTFDKTASTLKRWTNVSTDKNGKVSLSVPYTVKRKEEVKFYVRAYDTLNRFDQDTTDLKNTVGTVTPVGLNFKITGYVKSLAGEDGTLPYYNNGEFILQSKNLANGQLLYRVDDTVAGPGGLALGRYRYPTLYDGRYGKTLTDKSTLSKQNSSFKVDVPFQNTGVNPDGSKIDRSYIPYAYEGQAFYHLVTADLSNARNVIDVDRVSLADFKDVYNGNPEYMEKNLMKHVIMDNNTGEIFGTSDYYYIRELASFAGGAADNINGNNDFNAINPTWLRILRTDWPDITTFKLSKEPLKIGDTVSFDFDGYEYVSEDRNKADTRITVKDSSGNTVGTPILTNLKSDKSKKNTKKPNQEEAGYYQAKNVTGVPITKKGIYTAELFVEDSVKRFAKKELKFNVGCEENDPDPGCSEEPGNGDGEGNGSCVCEHTVEEGDVIEGTPEHMIANPVGKITEDEKVDTSAIFDVLKYGIATDEFLKVWGKSNRFLSDYKFQQYKGEIKYTITIDKTYNRSWKKHVPDTCYDSDGDSYDCSYDIPQSDTVHKEKEFEDVYEYSYWQIGHLIIYKLNDLTFENYALPDTKVLVMNNRHETVADAIHSDIWEEHVFPKLCDNVTLPSSSLEGGYSPPPVPDETELFKEAAKLGSRVPDVKNDSVKIKTSSKDIYNTVVSENETVHMDDTLTPSHGPTPVEIPIADIVDLEMSGQYIDKEKVNKYQTRSSITANYVPLIDINKDPEELVSFTNTSDDMVDGEKAINTVTVHTPVVMYGKASDDKAHDQRTNPPERSTPANPDTDRHAFVLDRPFTVTLPTAGQHLNEPGYGDRDFKKYYKGKEVKFPFDVYTETKQGFYPKDTWITIPLEEETTSFFMPVWVPEGKYSIEYRGIAINAPNDHVSNNAPKEHEANLNTSFRTPDEMMDNHIAYDTIEVDVIGRLYDMHITDILDYSWQNVFRSTDGLLTHTGASYWVGKNMIDGDPRGNDKPYVLPVRHGSHGLSYPNEMKNVAIKTGYQFRFDFKTKGTMYRNNDAIRITPSFSFVDYQGNREAVDVYYHDDNDYFVKIGSDADKTYREVILNDALRGVEREQLIATADFASRHITDYNSRYQEVYNEVGGAKDKFIDKYIKDLSKTPIQTGTYGFQVLNGNLRTFIGPEEDEVPNSPMVEAEDIVAREQHWYGEYSLPSNVYVVEKQEPQYDENGVEIPQVDKIAGYGQQHRLNENSSIFKKKGYIVVNFNIETIQNGNVDESHLTYHTSPNPGAPLNNQWQMEGFEYQFIDGYGKTFSLNDGDMVFYHANRSSFDDFNSNVTH